MPAAGLAQIAQVRANLAVAVNGAALEPSLLDQARNTLVVAGTLTLGLMQPRVEAAAMHTQHAAHRTDPKLPLVVAHKRVLCPHPLAEYAAAFFLMSRSSVTRLS